MPYSIYSAHSAATYYPYIYPHSSPNLPPTYFTISLSPIPISLSLSMSGVWVFKNGVVRLVENPGADSLDGGRQGSSRGRKVLVHLQSNEVITSYAVLERKLLALGWERYYDDPDLLQYHKRSTVHLISLPKDFNKFKSMHMYDIVVKNRNVFEVRDM